MPIYISRGRFTTDAVKGMLAKPENRCPARHLQPGDGAVGAALSRWLWGAGILCANLAGVGAPADTTYANQRKSAAILEKLYDQNPQHPGVTHFLIHAYDYHPLAQQVILAPPRARKRAGVQRRHDWPQ